MKNICALTTGFSKIGLYFFLCNFTVLAFTQTPNNIKGVKTDNTYANQTEVSKAKNATDEQVLNDLQGDYGLGDVVRIVVNTPKPAVDPLASKSNTGFQTNNSQTVILPKMETVTVATTVTNNNNVPAIQAKSAQPQAVAPPQYQPTNTSVSTVVTTNKTLVVPVENNIPPSRDTWRFEHQQYKWVMLPNNTVVKSPISDNTMASTSTTLSAADLTGSTQSQYSFSKETRTQQNTVSASEKTESTVNRSMSASNHSSRSFSHEKSSKSGGFSLKNVFSGSSKSNYRSAKHRKSSGRQGHKCYKF